MTKELFKKKIFLNIPRSAVFLNVLGINNLIFWLVFQTWIELKHPAHNCINPYCCPWSITLSSVGNSNFIWYVLAPLCLKQIKGDSAGILSPLCDHERHLLGPCRTEGAFYWTIKYFLFLYLSRGSASPVVLRFMQWRY